MTVRFTVRHRSNELEIGSFTLVDPATGADIGELRDDDEVDVSAQPNIRANAGSATSSVVFFLNGAKRTENEAPYAYFHDANGIYKPGRLTPGNYVLETTAYSGNNGTGQAGRTTTIRFTVVGESPNDNSASIHLYPNPATSAATLELNSVPGSRIVLEVADALGERYNALYQGVMHDSGSFKRELDLSTLQKGNYFLMVRIDEKVFVKRFAVKK